MLGQDPLLRAAWGDLLTQGGLSRPMPLPRREALLKQLSQAPAWERLALAEEALRSS